MKYYDQIVSRRHSCRSFSAMDIELRKITEVLEYYDTEVSLVPGIKTELKLFDGSVCEALGSDVGYNGFCIKAPYYFVLYSEKADHYLENAGFIIQGITLKLTELDIAACWLTINDAEAAKAALPYSTDLSVACVLAFGYRSPDEDVKVAPKLSYKKLAYSYKFGRALETEYFYNELEDSLRAAAHSQSFQNLQPYRLIVDDDIVSLVGLKSEMTNEYDTHLNYGIVMFNFQEVMRQVRANAPTWNFGDPGRDLGLPANASYVAKCGI